MLHMNFGGVVLPTNRYQSPYICIRIWNHFKCIFLVPLVSSCCKYQCLARVNLSSGAAVVYLVVSGTSSTVKISVTCTASSPSTVSHLNPHHTPHNIINFNQPHPIVKGRYILLLFAHSFDHYYSILYIYIHSHSTLQRDHPTDLELELIGPTETHHHHKTWRFALHPNPHHGYDDKYYYYYSSSSPHSTPPPLMHNPSVSIRPVSKWEKHSRWRFRTRIHSIRTGSGLFRPTTTPSPSPTLGCGYGRVDLKPVMVL